MVSPPPFFPPFWLTDLSWRTFFPWNHNQITKQISFWIPMITGIAQELLHFLFNTSVGKKVAILSQSQKIASPRSPRWLLLKPMVSWFLTCCINHYTKLVPFHHLFSLSVFLFLSLPPCLSELKQHLQCQCFSTMFHWKQVLLKQLFSVPKCHHSWAHLVGCQSVQFQILIVFALYGKETGYKRD